MKRVHAVAISVLLAVAALFGVVAVSRTTSVEASKPGVSPAAIAQRNRELDRTEAALRGALAKRPPALPAVPEPSAGGAAASQIVYRRPAPVVVTTRRPGGEPAEHEDGEREHEGDD